MPFTKSIENVGNITSNNNEKFSKVKVFIMLPTSIVEIEDIKESMTYLDKFSVNNPVNKFRSYYVSGKSIGQNQLLLFDTPSA
ncbi:hypothetical protein [Tamlana flava]|uniref:hypothetical protein n=1 Tax=Tamlana flava TaxID=3158572 RepID=UPI00351ABAC1